MGRKQCYENKGLKEESIQVKDRVKDTLPEILGSAEPGGGAEEDAEDEVPGTLAE